MDLTREFPGKSLHDFWDRYQAGLAAISKRNKMQKKPTEKSVTDILIGKSQWFNWNWIFMKVKPYDNMIKWLNRDEDTLDDVEVWKGELDDYSLENLKTWLDNGGKLGKGKVKQVVMRIRRRRRRRKSEF